MIIATRCNTFETNSSSVHTISVTKQRNTEPSPDSISAIKLGCFGQGDGYFTSPEDKLCYLWTAVTVRGEDINWWYFYLVDALGLPKNIHFETPQELDAKNAELDEYLDSTHTYIPESRWPWNYRYYGIDHDKNLDAFLRSMKNKNLLREFIWGKSSIATSTESDIEKVSKPQNIDWDSVDDSVWYSYGELNNKKNYIYIKGE